MSAVTVLRLLPPLVVDLGRGSIAWIENGIGFVLHQGAAHWQPLTDATDLGIGGHVLSPAQVARVVLQHGRPTP